MNWPEASSTPGRACGCPSQSEAVSRIVSIALRTGIRAEDIVHQLRGVTCQACVRKPGVEALSCADAIGRAIQQADHGRPLNNPEPQADVLGDDTEARYPDCGGPTRPDGRCRLYLECGYRRCTG